MRTLQLVDSISLSPFGPWSQSGPVHLRQGDADGACGPYCVLMALLASGLVYRESLESSPGQDGRTRLGRVWNRFGTLGPLACRGSDNEDLESIAGAFGKSIRLETHKKPGWRSLRRFIDDSLSANLPVIIGTAMPGGIRHWVLGVGKFAWPDATGYLVLDPGCDASATSAWNAVIEISNERRTYPHSYWLQTDERDCAIETAMAVVTQSPAN